jgi:zinc transport system ATP-binding protein
VAQHPEFARLFAQNERQQLAVYTHHHVCDEHDHHHHQASSQENV